MRNLSHTPKGRNVNETCPPVLCEININNHLIVFKHLHIFLSRVIGCLIRLLPFSLGKLIMLNYFVLH